MADNNTRIADGLRNAVHVGGVFVTSDSTNFTVTLTSVVRNVGDGKRESTALFGVFPVTVKQSNYPRATGRNQTTNDVGAGTNALIRAGGVSYITAEPAMASLSAKIRGLPDWIETAWSGNLTTERTERGTLDNRELIASNLVGVAAYDITAALTNEVVGGKCVLQSRVDDRVTGTHEFFIRGKNPLDETALAYINANVDADFQPFAWMIAKHESLDDGRVYNQFNSNEDLKELPNKTDGANRWGWGMCQIDKGQFGDTTAEVYDWHVNVASMNSMLRQKTNQFYTRFVRYYRNRYGTDPSWVEPENDVHTIRGISVSAKMWAYLILYNGVEGVPVQTVGRRSFRSPIEFVPSTAGQAGRWVFHDNVNAYGDSVLRDSSVVPVE